ncbi:MAG: glycosyltransferase family 39 protein [Desulfatiglandaceae bacterium]
MRRAVTPFLISRYSLVIAAIIMLGCVVRVVACLNTCVVNPDGVVYIHQAAALYHGRIDAFWAPGMSYLSIQPFLIAGAYFFTGNWLVSAMGVSWFFGSAVLLVIFLLLRRFFDRPVTALGLLLFSVMPVFVDISCMVIKEPVAVFFVALGLYFFLGYIEQAKLKFLLWSGICFLFASWARIESLMFMGVSAVFILFAPRKKLTGLAVFLIPVAGILAAVAVSNTLTGIGAGELLRSKKILSFFSDILIRYDSLRLSLKELAFSEGRSNVGLFLDGAPNLLWFAALGAVIKCLVKALFYPVVFLFAVGLPRAFRLLLSDRRIFYLGAVAVGSLVVLYFHELTHWYIFPRYMTLSILPSMFVLCCGIASVRDFLQRRLNAPEPIVAVLLAVCLVLMTLPKNLRERECDKLVFRRIGEAAAAESVGGPVMISASASIQRWVSFYANIGNPDRFDGRILDNHWEKFSKVKEQFISELHKRAITYILWDELSWGEDRFPIQELLDWPGAEIIGEWSHPDTGRMILFELKETN